MIDYQKYLNKQRQHPDAVILVKNGKGYRAFHWNAVLIAEKLNKSIRRVERHRTVSISRDDVSKLVQAGLPVEYA